MTLFPCPFPIPFLPMLSQCTFSMHFSSAFPSIPLNHVQPQHTATPQLCSNEARDADRGTGVVIRCLIQKVEQVSEGCARELSRVVSTALQFYEPVRFLRASLFAYLCAKLVSIDGWFDVAMPV